MAKRRIKTIDALEQTTVYQYDANGNVTAVIDPRGNETRTYYDALNRPVGVEDAAGDVTTYDYDEAGNMVQETRPDGSAITKSYDGMNRLADVYANNQEAQHFEYDSLSRMILADDYNEGNATHSVIFEYNAFNQVTAEVQDGRRIEKFYDDNGNLEDLVYPDTGGFVVHRTYNGLNLPDSIKDQSQNNIAGFAYNLNGRVAAMTLGNGIEESLSYNDRGMEGNRIYADINNTTLYSMETVYDGMGNIFSETIERAISTTPTLATEQYEKQYGYDDLNRLTFEQKGTADTVQWQHDPVGNWTYTNQNGSPEERVPNEVNEYSNVTGMTPGYDARGNMTSDGAKTYEYDWANRLVAVKTSDGIAIATYRYDALNRRVTQSYGGQTTAYIYDGGQVIEEYEDGQFQRSFVYGIYIDDPIMMEDNAGNRYYYLKDRQYSVTALTDENGNIVETYEYTAFGLMTILNGQGVTISESTVDNPYGYTGRRWDGESGLWYYRNRMYSAKLGRFMQRDPAGYMDGLNLYAYVRNNPIIFTDPEGLMTKAAWDYTTGLGTDGAQWYADKYIETGNPLYFVGGVLASLWTPETADETISILGVAGGTRIIGAAIEGASTLAGISKGTAIIIRGGNLGMQITTNFDTAFRALTDQEITFGNTLNSLFTGFGSGAASVAASPILGSILGDGLSVSTRVIGESFIAGLGAVTGKIIGNVIEGRSIMQNVPGTFIGGFTANIALNAASPHLNNNYSFSQFYQNFGPGLNSKTGEAILRGIFVTEALSNAVGRGVNSL